MDWRNNYNKNTQIVRRRLIASSYLLALTLVLAGCRNDIETIHQFDPTSLPDQTVHNAVVTRSEYGNIEMILTAPTIESFSEPKKQTVYPDGVNIKFFDRNHKVAATLTADYAVSNESENTMEARGNVVIIDYSSGDTSYLKHIVWDTYNHRIRSDSVVRSVNGQRITVGDRFESDDDFINPLIVHQRGVIEWNEE